jgi:hypothetical protein
VGRNDNRLIGARTLSEISLGQLSICIEQDDEGKPVSVLVTGPDGTEYTRPWPDNGELNMALGLGLIHVMRRMRAAGDGGDPGGDPHFANVVLLAGFDGADGATSFTDEGNSAHTLAPSDNAQIDTEQSQFGGASLRLDGTGVPLSIMGKEMGGELVERNVGINDLHESGVT